MKEHMVDIFVTSQTCNEVEVYEKQAKKCTTTVPSSLLFWGVAGKCWKCLATFWFVALGDEEEEKEE